jgi:tRNA threonylcarbamoyladenosine biosynthesis protein TsaB
MKILAIETATEACSAAVYNDGEITARFEFAPREHTQLILPMLDDVLEDAGVTREELDAIAFGCGPGAFTGLRIAVGIAQGLGLALNKPLIPISTLATMAELVLENQPEAEGNYIAALDARMGEVYWGEYAKQGDELVLIGEEQVSAPEALTEYGKPAIVFGSGWEAYQETFLQNPPPWIKGIIREVFPSAYYVAKLAAAAWLRGETIDAADAEPVYLRNNVALKKGEQGKA